jgi:hypothetical protein
MILAGAVLAERLAPLAFEGDRSRVEEHELQLREQMPAAGEQVFLDRILHAPRCEWCGMRLLVLRQRLSQPFHGPVGLVQPDLFRSGNLDIPAPVEHTRTIAARLEQPVQHGHEQHPFNGQREPPPGEQPLDGGGDSQILPETAEHQRRSDALALHRGGVACLVGRDDHRLLGELGAGPRRSGRPGSPGGPCGGKSILGNGGPISSYVLHTRVPRTTQSPARTTPRGLPGRNSWPGWVRSFRSRARTVAATSGRSRSLPTQGPSMRRPPAGVGSLRTGGSQAGNGHDGIACVKQNRRQCHPPAARPPTRASSCRSTMTAKSCNRRPKSCL